MLDIPVFVGQTRLALRRAVLLDDHDMKKWMVFRVDDEQKL